MRFPYKGITKDQNGAVVLGATVSVYLAGTTTAADVYAASSGGAHVSSVTSSSTTGAFEFWVDTADYAATQWFKITLSKTGFVSQDFDDILVIPYGYTP